MKKIKLLLLSVMFLFCIMSGCGTQTEANTSVNEDTDNSLSVNDVKIHIPEDYVQVHMLSECREILDEMLTDLDLRHEKIDIASYEIIHCQSVEGTGFYVKEIVSSEKVGEEVRNCTHGGVGVVDKRYQYMDRYKEYCTVCGQESVYSETRWGDWVCSH